ncbi:MAG: 16S rRNA (cytosine(1402)-N(4))-methyltransferase RsmH [Candidatus Omnitrophica bacterium]|nr:16S rRNA (cytosine(1402)-N(4))-methyltransferase RsmH [Candidatus Omnitrophota bacterium]
MDSSHPEAKSHEPVLLEEVLSLLDIKPGQVIVDATLGSGGHAREILKHLGPQGRLIGIDQDPEALKRTQENLRDFPQIEFIAGNFSKLDQVLITLNIHGIHAVILDVGLSTEQLEEARRGFSFLKEGPLDMRMDPGSGLTARDLVNDLSQKELEKLFRTYGEERWAKRIAGTICTHRGSKPIETTADLVQLIKKAVPRPFHFGARHPATRVFQALRIRVNQELESLQGALPKAFEALFPGGRLVVISFHSLEDRIVKEAFRAWAREGKAQLLTRKPIRPSEAETQRNPRSRSARLRAIEKK